MQIDSAARAAPCTQRIAHRPITFLAGAALLGIFLFFLLQNQHRIRDQNHLSDFRTFYAAADALAHGNSPYHTDTPRNYVYPPLIAWLLIPLLPLGPGKAAVVFLGGDILLRGGWGVLRLAGI